MTETRIQPELFWKTYAEGGFLRLERSGHGSYIGTLLDFATQKPVVFGVEKAVSIDRDSITGYDFDTDPQFAQGPTSDLTTALGAVLTSPSMRDDQRPIRDQLTLVTRILRDAQPIEHSFSAILRTKGLVKDYVSERISRDEALQALGALHSETEGSLETWVGTVLDALDKEWLKPEVAARLFYADTPPREMPFQLLWRLVVATLLGVSLPTGRALAYLAELMPTTEDFARLTDSGDIAAVNAERRILIRALARCPTESEISRILIRTVENHANDDLFVTMETVDAIGIHNDKSCIGPLLDYLGRPDMARFRDNVEGSLQRLCSGKEIIPRAIHGVDPESLSEAEIALLGGDEDGSSGLFEQLYWKRVASALPSDDAGWLERDSASVYWETRLRSALRLASESLPRALVSALTTDEVTAVRAAASSAE